MIGAAIDAIVLTMASIGWVFIIALAMIALTMLWYGK